MSRSDNPNKTAALGAFNVIRAVPRDVIVHGYQGFNDSQVAFLERRRGGSPTAKRHRYSHTEFATMVANVINQANAFIEAVGVDWAEITAFGEAAFNLNKKSKTSPGNPV